ncbi:MAG: ATP-binding protein [Gemmatales bacterium]
MNDQIHVVSHVARDLLQTAAVFKTDKQVVWEYVANSLQYSQPGRPVRVEVTIEPRRKKIVISDNGRGMNWEGLQNFWMLHGENQDRLAGNIGRGRFGTGKAAAFGIASVLRVTSTQNGRKSIVELRRSNIENLGSGKPIPVSTIKKELESSEQDGTTIEIEETHIRQLDTQGIIKYIERHLAHYPRDVSVIVNSHLCEYSEPPIDSERVFTPNLEESNTLSNVTLNIKVTRSSLPMELRGIAIFSKGVWHETTLAGSEGKEMSQFIFGEIDVPAIEEDRSEISAFDNTRSLLLNRENNVVFVLLSFIGRCVECVRRELLSADKQRQKTEEAKRLAKQAGIIADVLNDDFAQFRNLLRRVRARRAGGDDNYPLATNGGSGNESLIEGDELPGSLKDSVPSRTESGTRDGDTRKKSPIPIEVQEGEEKNKAQLSGSIEGRKRRPSGGFSVLFRNMGTDNDRSQYVPDERSIHINLDHPQLLAARSGNSEDEINFRRLCYEIAFTEYSIAVAYEMANQDEYLEPSEPIADIRTHINRLARRASTLFGQVP